MSIVKKEEFIPHFLKIIEKKLNTNLPSQDYESKMLKKAWNILAESILHISHVINNEDNQSF